MTATRRDNTTPDRPRGRTALVVLLAALLAAGGGFAALGSWQLQRLQWKRDLIARVTARVHAPADAAPARADWPRVSRDAHEYRHVRLEGRFLSGHDTRVQALTALGGGFWILTPFQTTDGDLVLVNRGFVPRDWRGDGLSAGAATFITGLLRLPEPGGAFLRRNDAAAGRWYSRDVAAIATTRGLGPVAPFFVDLDAPPASPVAAATSGKAISAPTAGAAPASDSATLAHSPATAAPRAGLTVVSFRNNHLSYALTWFALALMCAGAAGYVAWDARRRQL